MFSYLARGSMSLALVLVAINSITSQHAPLGDFFLDAGGISIPFWTIFFSVVLYVGISLIAGFITRRQLIRRRGLTWYEEAVLGCQRHFNNRSLFTLIYLFMIQGGIIIENPLSVLMIVVLLVIGIIFVFIIGMGLSNIFELTYEETSPTSLIGTSNHFEAAPLQ